MILLLGLGSAQGVDGSQDRLPDGARREETVGGIEGPGGHGGHCPDSSRAGRRYSLPVPCVWLRAPEVARSAALVRGQMAALMKGRERADPRIPVKVSENVKIRKQGPLRLTPNNDIVDITIL